jgi:ribonuclease P/MRP protein subunit RPP20
MSALGAAIPLLTTITTSLPSILPFPADQIHCEYKTGTVQVQDELVPEDEGEDVVYESRGKSNLTVIIRINGGDDDLVLLPRRNKKVSTKRDVNRPAHVKAKPSGPVRGTTPTPEVPQEVIFQEPDQEDMDDS